jgi:hypothetical protein
MVRRLDRAQAIVACRRIGHGKLTVQCRMKIPYRFTPLVFAFAMSLMMAFLMSAVLTLVNLGAVPDFFSRWMRAFAIAWCCAFPAVVLVAPLARLIVTRLVEASPSSR